MYLGQPPIAFLLSEINLAGIVQTWYEYKVYANILCTLHDSIYIPRMRLLGRPGK